MFKLRLNMVAMLPVRAFSMSPTRTGKKGLRIPFDLLAFRAIPAEPLLMAEQGIHPLTLWACLPAAACAPGTKGRVLLKPIFLHLSGAEPAPIRKEVMHIAIFHMNVQIISRSAGRSAVAASAYRSGTRVADTETGLVADYSHKGGVMYSEIQLPDNAPAAFTDRQVLWNSVQSVEKRKDSQLAREVEVALPRELSEQDWRQMIRNFVSDNFVSKGMCADWSIHIKGTDPDGMPHNPHCHILLTTRPLKEDGSWGAKTKQIYLTDEEGNRIPAIDPKTGQQKIGAGGRKMWKRDTVPSTSWDSRDNVTFWREAWAAECNRWIDQHNKLVSADQQVTRIDHRSYKDQGVSLIPTQHEGYYAQQLAKSGQVSERVFENDMIRVTNIYTTSSRTLLQRIGDGLKSLARKVSNIYRKRKDQLNDVLRKATRQLSSLGFTTPAVTAGADVNGLRFRNPDNGFIPGRNESEPATESTGGYTIRGNDPGRRSGPDDRQSGRNSSADHIPADGRDHEAESADTKLKPAVVHLSR